MKYAHIPTEFMKEDVKRLEAALIFQNTQDIQALVSLVYLMNIAYYVELAKII